MNNKYVYIKRAVQRGSFKRILNLGKIQVQKLFVKSEKSWGYPIILVFDPASICILSCPLCPTGQKRTERTKGIAKLEYYKKIIDEIGDYLFFIQYGNWGEPLINKDLAKMVKHANKKNIETIIRSNLILLNNKNAKDLIKAGLDEIIVSLDGATEKTYLKYRIGGDFNKVIRNIKLLNRLKKKYNSNLRIIWQFIVSSVNELEVPKAKKMAKKIGATLRLVPIRVDMGKELTADRKEQITKNFLWIPKNKKFSNYDYKKKKNRFFEKNCRWLWTKTVINWNGSVSPCCAVWEEKYDFGNAYKRGYKNIWNNTKYKRARNIIKNKIYDKKIICHKCLKNGFIN